MPIPSLFHTKIQVKTDPLSDVLQSLDIDLICNSSYIIKMQRLPRTDSPISLGIHLTFSLTYSITACSYRVGEYTLLHHG